MANSTNPEVGIATPRPLLAASTLCWREMVRFFRQRNRVVGAVGQPVLFWLLFGVGLKSSFELSAAGESGQSFLEYYFPGTLVLILLFTAIFTTISIIEDRREGFLQSVLVAPIPRWSMVLGKIGGGTLIALLQGLIFLLLALTLEVRFELLGLLLLVGFLLVAAIGLTGLGFVIAWKMESTQGFHAIMSLVLLPMWLLSGAFFPVPALTDQATWSQVVLHWGMRVNPVTYIVAGVRRSLFDQLPTNVIYSPNLEVCWGVTLGFALLMFLLAIKISAQRTSGDLL
jgi:ABC-2 type transport system permease protein